MKNAATNTLFELRDVHDTHIAELLDERAPSRSLRGVTYWRLPADGSFIWTRSAEPIIA